MKTSIKISLILLIADGVFNFIINYTQLDIILIWSIFIAIQWLRMTISCWMTFMHALISFMQVLEFFMPSMELLKYKMGVGHFALKEAVRQMGDVVAGK